MELNEEIKSLIDKLFYYDSLVPYNADHKDVLSKRQYDDYQVVVSRLQTLGILDENGVYPIGLDQWIIDYIDNHG